MVIKEQLKKFVGFCEERFYNKIEEMSFGQFQRNLAEMGQEEKEAYEALASCYPKHNKFILVKKFIQNRYDLDDLQIDMKFIKEEEFKKERAGSKDQAKK